MLPELASFLTLDESVLKERNVLGNKIMNLMDALLKKCEEGGFRTFLIGLQDCKVWKTAAEVQGCFSTFKTLHGFIFKMAVHEKDQCWVTVAFF